MDSIDVERKKGFLGHYVHDNWETGNFHGKTSGYLNSQDINPALISVSYGFVHCNIAIFRKERGY